MDKPKALIFDLGNVLFEIDIPLCSRNVFSLLDSGVNRSEFKESFRQKNEALETGELSKAVFINFILRHSKKGVQALDVILAWNSMLIGMPGNHFDMLKQLKKKYKLYLLSNINAFHHPRFLEMIAEDHGITDFDTYFDQCFYSHKIGHRKPESLTFEYVLKQIQFKPQEVLYMDDTLEHLNTAKLLGIQVHHVSSIHDTQKITENLLQL
jgi:putative hydrolase of the HAD superfamily